MTKPETIELVSIHGGHSGEFCNHARDTLEEIVKAYIAGDFSWIGLTEHMPPVSDNFLYAEEIEAGLDATKIQARFARYISTGRALQSKYAGQLDIFVGFETETYSGYVPYVKKLITEFQPDYIVGSVHHINDIPFDLTEQQYLAFAHNMGGLETLYCRYFDQQYEMINRLKPQVVGHFDLIRLFDSDYPQRLQKPEIRDRTRRNLQRIRELGLILDLNVNPLSKGASESYPAKSILLEARTLGIPVVPGDDSHSISGAGLNIAKGITLLQQLGFKTNWSSLRQLLNNP
jgi:histidinol-phosphatase (PHP family)